MSEQDNSYLKKVVLVDGKLKHDIINYVGLKLQPETNEVTLEMVISTMADEFPELLLSIAEENFLKGYELGLNDQTALKMEK
jgi:hypothetical protein